MTVPCWVGVPSGSGEPLEMQAARVRAKRERPQPGAASRRVRWPRGMRPGHSQLRGWLGTSESRKTPIGEKAGERADWAGMPGKAGLGVWSGGVGVVVVLFGRGGGVRWGGVRRDVGRGCGGQVRERGFV